MPKGTKQRDAQRWGQLDDHLHRQAGVHLLRGHGPRPESRHPGAPSPQHVPQRRRRRGDAGADRRVLLPQPPRLVRRRGVGDDVQEPGEHALRRSRHLPVPGGLAVGPAADPGAGDVGEERRDHLPHRAHLHLHPRARAEVGTAPTRGGHTGPRGANGQPIVLGSYFDSFLLQDEASSRINPVRRPSHSNAQFTLVLALFARGTILVHSVIIIKVNSPKCPTLIIIIIT